MQKNNNNNKMTQPINLNPMISIHEKEIELGLN